MESIFYWRVMIVDSSKLPQEKFPKVIKKFHFYQQFVIQIKIALIFLMMLQKLEIWGNSIKLQSKNCQHLKFCCMGFDFVLNLILMTDLKILKNGKIWNSLDLIEYLLGIIEVYENNDDKKNWRLWGSDLGLQN